jgi:hypothetical protein
MTRHLKIAALAVLTALLLSVGMEPHGNSTPPAPTKTVAPAEQTAASMAPAKPSDTVKLESPYRAKPRSFKGQLHAHTTNSDGTQSPAVVMAAYKKAGYDFAAITDHNHNTPDPGVKGILFLPGVENDHTCLHENRINATTVAPGSRMPQDVIDQARREGSFVQINHPDWPGRYPTNPCWSDKALLAMKDYHAIETWNASNGAENNNAERRVDFLLSNGMRTNLTAVDDCHDVRHAYCMTASVHVFADVLTVDDVMANLLSGNFYASSGANVTSVTVDGRNIAITLPKASDVEFIVNGGKVAKTERAVLTSSYVVAGDEKYVRIRVTRVSDKRQAWSNPIYVTLL